MSITYISHTGVKGMRWGIRRYQNPDGTLTEAGKRHYAKTGEEGYHYKSLMTKHYEKKAVRLENRRQKAERAGKSLKAERLANRVNDVKSRAEYNRKIDARMQEYAKSATWADKWLRGKSYLTLAAVMNENPSATAHAKAAVQRMASLYSDISLRTRGYEGFYNEKKK